MKETILQEKEEGFWTFWHPNGQKGSEGNYSSGETSGCLETLG